jgi:hypothetical protein
LFPAGLVLLLKCKFKPYLIELDIDLLLKKIIQGDKYIKGFTTIEKYNAKFHTVEQRRQYYRSIGSLVEGPEVINNINGKLRVIVC